MSVTFTDQECSLMKIIGLNNLLMQFEPQES